MAKASSGISSSFRTSRLNTSSGVKRSVSTPFGITKNFAADLVVSVESRGFIFAGHIASDLRLPFVLARKPGKLPNATYKKSFDLEYGSTSIEIQKNTEIKIGQKVVIIDDLIATGGTAIACAELLTENFKIERSDILLLCVIDLPDLGGSEKLTLQGYNVETLISY